MERSGEIGGCDLDRSAYAVPQYQFAPVSVAGAMATPLYQRHIIA